MKTTTKLLALLLMLSVWLPETALAQIPLPANCTPPPGLINNTAPDRTINFKMNGNIMPRPHHPKDQMTGFILADNRVDVTFNLPHNRPDGPGRYSLVTYKFNPGTDGIAGTADDIYTLYDYESIIFPLGNTNQLSARIPNCLYRVFFIRGCIQDPLIPTGTGQVYGGFEGVDPNGQIIREGLPHPVDETNLAICDDCPGQNNVAETDHFQFRFIEQINNGDGTTRLFFSVINKGIQAGDGSTYTSINPFLTGDVSFEGNELSVPPSVLQVTLPQHNVPYNAYRFNYQIRNEQGQPAGSQNRFVTFDHRNHHDNHDFIGFQSDVFVLTVPTASLANLTQVRICAEISDKHPEPGQTLPPVECGIVDIGCDQGEEPCVEVDGVNGDFHAELVGDVTQDGTNVLATIKVTNTSGEQLEYVEFADFDNVAPNIEFVSPPSTPANFTVSGIPATTRFTYTGGTTFTEGTFTIKMTSSSYVLSGQAIKINFKAANTGLDNAIMELAECGEIVPLPVRLTRFDAKYVDGNKQVLVSWQTAMEENNQGFTIERSADGKEFSEVGQVAGGPNGNSIRDYKFMDEQPIKGMSFYRLKQSDFDGTVNYSKIAMVNNGKAKADLTISLAPNPCANGDCEIRLANASSSETTIELVDLTGRLVFRQTVDGQVENIRIPAKEVRGLKGVFLLHAKSGNATASQRIVLQ